MKKINFFLLLIFTISCYLNAQDLIWSVETDTNNVYNAGYLQLDAQDNIYVSGGNQNICLLKLDKDGLIQYLISDPEEGSVSDIKLNQNGKLYVAGIKESAITFQDALLQVYEDGNLLFEQQYDYIGKNDKFSKLCLDDENNIYACGTSYNASIEQMAMIAKYSEFGIPVWIQHFGNSQHHIYVSGIHLTSSGDIMVSGYRSPTSPGPVELVYLRYNNNGVLQAELVSGIFGYLETHPSFSIIDSQDNLYIGGYVYTSKDAGFLCKISNDNIAWSQVLLNPGGNSSLFSASLDESGNVYCCGVYENTNYDGYIIKMSNDGGLLNEAFYTMPGNQFVQLSKIICRDGYTYISGAAEGIGTGYDVLITKYNGELELMWDHVYNSFENNGEYASSIALDTEGNVIIGGVSISTSGYKALVQKYSNPLGITYNNPHTSELHVYPNPAEDFLCIAPAPSENIITYRIFDAGGKMCLTGQLSSKSDPLIPVAGLDAGLYVIQLHDGNAQSNHKFLKK